MWSGNMIKSDEIFKSCDILGISLIDVSAYFFTQNV